MSLLSTRLNRAVVAFKSVRYVRRSFLNLPLGRIQHFGYLVIDSLVWKPTGLPLLDHWFSFLLLLLSKFRPVSSRLLFITICLTTTLLITCFFYRAIWRKMRKSTVGGFSQNQGARFFRSIFLVTVVSFITWIPFLCVHICIALRVSPVLKPASFLSSLFNSVTRLSNSLSTFLGFIVSESPCLL